MLLATLPRCVLLLVLATGLRPSPARAQFTSDSATRRIAAWRGDLDSLINGLAHRHAAPFVHVPVARFTAVAGELHDRVPGLTEPQFRVALIRLTAMLGDSHTALDWTHRDFGAMPLRLRHFSDGIRVVAAMPMARSVLGARVVGVAGVPVDAVAGALRPLMSCENNPCRDALLADFIVVPDFLAAQGLIRDPAHVTLDITDSAGRQLAIDLPTVPGAIWESAPMTQVATAPGGPEERLAQRNPQLNIWFELVVQSNTLYIGYQRSSDLPGHTVRAVIDSILALLDTHPVERVIVDLRRNGGGNAALLNPLISGLHHRASLARRGRVFALIGGQTSESAVDNATALHDHDGAILVGTATAQRPDPYAELRRFGLPATGWQVQYPDRLGRTGTGQPDALLPELLTPLYFAEFLAGHDAAIRAALAFRIGK
jgi:hypothetical protein